MTLTQTQIMTLNKALNEFIESQPRTSILHKDYSVFTPIAKAILNGYFEVRKGNTPIKFVRPTKVEFYYHEEFTDKEEMKKESVTEALEQLYSSNETYDETLLIKDYIVYHQNALQAPHFPLFEVGTLNNHISGIDITFEHKSIVNSKEVNVRASALIRGFYVYTDKKECEVGLPIPSKYKDSEDLKYPEDRCTFLYDHLYGTSPIFEDGFTIKWIDCPGSLEPYQAPRKNVWQYTAIKDIKNNNIKIKKTKIPDNRKFQYFNPYHYLDKSKSEMKKIDIEKDYEKRIQETWYDPLNHCLPYINYGFTLPSQAIEDSLVFLGINPSYNGQPTVQFYDLQKATELPYFMKFQEISTECGIPWSHMDALWLRQTKQNDLKNQLIHNTQLCEFAHKQFHITKEILYRIKPRIIVICNTFAREWFLHESETNGFSSEGFDVEFDETLGTYRIINDLHLNGTPVFCSSMLSGQRALDKGSLERLVWHIKFVLNNI